MQSPEYFKVIRELERLGGTVRNNETDSDSGLTDFLSTDSSEEELEADDLPRSSSDKRPYTWCAQRNPENIKRILKNFNSKQPKKGNLVESEWIPTISKRILELTYKNELLRNNTLVVKPCLRGCKKCWATTSLNSKKTGKVRVKEEFKRLMRMDKRDWNRLMLMSRNYGKPEILKKERCTAEKFKPEVDSKEVLVEGRFSDSEPESEGDGFTLNLTDLNESESERIIKNQMNLPHRNLDTNTCMPVQKEVRGSYQDRPLQETRLEYRKWMVKTRLPRFVVLGEQMKNQSLLSDPEMIRDKVRELEKLHHTVKVAKIIIQNIRDLNLRFTDCLFKSLTEMQIRLKNSF